MDLFDSRVSGFITVTPDNPATGANLIWENQFNGRIQLVAARLTFATDATVTDRLIIIRGADGTGNFGYSPAPGFQLANETITYNFAPCTLGIDASAQANFMTAPLSGHIYLDRLQHLQIVPLQLQTADAITNVDFRFLITKPFQ